MVPICCVDRTLIVSYRQVQTLGCFICIIPCSAFSFFLNKEQYKEWELKIQVMLSGRIMDLFCTKCLYCWFVYFSCFIAMLLSELWRQSPSSKPASGCWAGRSSSSAAFTRVVTEVSVGAAHSTHPHEQHCGQELWDKLETSRLPIKSSPSTNIQSLNGTWGFIGKEPIKDARELGMASTALPICEEA